MVTGFNRPDAAIQIGMPPLFGLSRRLAMNAMGGGDVKLIGALALWLPFPAVVVLLIVMSISAGCSLW